MKGITKTILALGIVALVPQISFGIMREMDLKDLTAEATEIVTGTVLEAKADWTPAGSIETRVKILIEDRLLGNEPGNVVELSIPGGEVGEMGLYVSDMPKFVEGTRVLVFLAHPAAEGPYVVGLRQGKFTLDKGKVIENGLSEGDLMERVRDEIRAKREAK
ncbi:MAG: hypothetical protein AB1714_15640 [Acidobacteriota bacterium]